MAKDYRETLKRLTATLSSDQLVAMQRAFESVGPKAQHAIADAMQAITPKAQRAMQAITPKKPVWEYTSATVASSESWEDVLRTKGQSRLGGVAYGTQFRRIARNLSQKAKVRRTR